MSLKGLIAVFAMLVLIAAPVTAEKCGKILVLYKTWHPRDGWVEYSYKNSHFWDNFRNEVESYGNVSYEKHVNSSMLRNYCMLFILTPIKKIPNEEARAIKEWVRNGGELIITQDKCKDFANEITSELVTLTP